MQIPWDSADFQPWCNQREEHWKRSSSRAGRSSVVPIQNRRESNGTASRHSLWRNAQRRSQSWREDEVRAFLKAGFKLPGDIVLFPITSAMSFEYVCMAWRTIDPNRPSPRSANTSMLSRLTTPAPTGAGSVTRSSRTEDDDMAGVLRW